MKMVKKILLGMVATAAVLTFASCKMGAGEGETEGNKWDKTMTVDGTKIPDDVQPNAQEKGPYRRFWEEFSSNEKCAEITTKITVDVANSIMDNGVATAGLAFDLNKSEDGKTVDFILVGLSTGGYYVERYYNIEKGKTVSGDTSDSALGTYTPLDGKGDVNYHVWAKAPKTDENGNYVFTVKIAQETPKVYTVYIDDVKVSVDSEMAKLTPAKTEKIKKDGVEAEYAVGGIACYGSVVKGNKLVVNYLTEEDSVTGKLEAEEIAE